MICAKRCCAASLLLLAVGAGCRSTVVDPIYSTRLDNGLMVELNRTLDRSGMRGSDTSYSRLSVVARDVTGAAVFSQDLARRAYRTEGELASFRFGTLEARSDSPGRMWLVDRRENRVVLSVDTDARTASGPDELPPSWATTTGGRVLSIGRPTEAIWTSP